MFSGCSSVSWHERESTGAHSTLITYSGGETYLDHSQLLLGQGQCFENLHTHTCTNTCHERTLFGPDKSVPTRQVIALQRDRVAGGDAKHILHCRSMTILCVTTAICILHICCDITNMYVVIGEPTIKASMPEMSVEMTTENATLVCNTVRCSRCGQPIIDCVRRSGSFSVEVYRDIDNVSVHGR